MKNYPLWKIFLVFILVSLGVIFAIPSILYQEDSGNWYLDNRLNLGLDLQGGSYLLLEVQTDVLIDEEFENFSDTVRIIARENRVKINNIEKIDDELKAIYHSKDSICIWIFKNRIERNKFMDETCGMLKNERENHYKLNYKTF